MEGFLVSHPTSSKELNERHRLHAYVLTENAQMTLSRLLAVALNMHLTLHLLLIEQSM